MTLPFDGAIGDYYRNAAPEAVRTAIASAGKKDVLSQTYPYRQRMKREAYDQAMDALQLQLVRLQPDVTSRPPRPISTASPTTASFPSAAGPRCVRTK